MGNDDILKIDSIDKLQAEVRRVGIPAEESQGDLKTLVGQHLLKPVRTLSPLLVFRASWDPRKAIPVPTMVTMIKQLPPRARLASMPSKGEEWI